MEFRKGTSCNRKIKEKCICYKNTIPCIIVHGGAGNFSDSIAIEKMTACKKAAINGYKKLISGESSVNAVEAALWWLECDEFFNSGYGSVLNEIGILYILHNNKGHLNKFLSYYHIIYKFS